MTTLRVFVSSWSHFEDSHDAFIFLTALLLTITLTLGAQAPRRRPRHHRTIRGEAMHAVAGDGHALVAVGGASVRAPPARRRSPGAADWAMKKFNEWGLKNVHIERFPFGQGWTIERFSVHLLDAADRGAHRPAALVLAVDQRPGARRRRARARPPTRPTSRSTRASCAARS